VTIKYRQRRLDSEISLRQLAEYVTQDGNPGNIRGIATANVELPADILRRGFYFIDTPGLGSVIAENTATTNAFLPESDALLLVTSFDSPLTDDEFIFARAALGDLPVFVMLNKQDLVTPVKRDQAVAFVRRHLEGLGVQRPVGIFSVSARDALAAKLSNDSELLAASGLPPLEDELVRFLVEKKRTVFLSRMCIRVEELLGDLPTFDGSGALRQQAATLERTAEDMRRFALKQSAARRELQTNEDQTAPQRALTLVAGRRNVNFAAGHASDSPLTVSAAPRVGERIGHD
jgi:hypothetical protein